MLMFVWNLLGWGLAGVLAKVSIRFLDGAAQSQQSRSPAP